MIYYNDMDANEVFYGRGKPEAIGNNFLTLQKISLLPKAILIGAEPSREEVIDTLSLHYLSGFRQFARRKEIFTDLPPDPLWPEKFRPAYEWMIDAWHTLKGAPDLVIGEIIRNADMHGKGFRGAAAAWATPSLYVLGVADYGRGQPSEAKGDNMGHAIIQDFATEDMQSSISKGHVLNLRRNLESVQLPEQKLLFGNQSIAPEIDFIRKRRAQGKKLPQYHPDSSVYYTYEADAGPYGGLAKRNRLDQVLSVEVHNEEPDSFY